jgi:hypothetical protein
MSLETIYYVGQTVAVGAILASLVAIYIQQRKDHAFAQADSEREILQETAHWFDDLLAYPRGLEDLQSSLQDYHNATPRAQAVLAQHMLKSVTIAEQAFFMNEQKLINYDSHMKLVMLPILHISTPGGRQYWDNTKVAFGAKIVAVIDKILEENPPSPDAFYEIFPYFGPGRDAVAETTTPSGRETDSGSAA